MKYCYKILFVVSLCPLFLSAQQEKRPALGNYEVSLGAAWPESRSFAQSNAHYALGLGYAWDLNPAFIELRLDHIDHFSSPQQTYTDVSMGGSYIFLDQDVWAMYGGADVGLGVTKVSGIDMIGGFQVGGDLGALFLRDAAVSIDTRARFIYNTASIRNSHPAFLVFMVGLRF